MITDISVPKPDSIHWTFDPRATVVSEDHWNPQLAFEEAGTFTVTMTSFFQSCEYSVIKQMEVNPYDPKSVLEKLPGYKPIESAEVSPNPGNGTFSVAVKLSKKFNVSIRIYDVLGVKHYDKNWSEVDNISETIALEKSPEGMYLLRAVTDSDARDIRIIIKK